MSAYLNQEQGNSKDLMQTNYEEYRVLREEMLKRVEFRYQMISYILIGAAGFISVGVEQNSASLLFIYPILSVFLFASWVHNGVFISNLGYYIMRHIESLPDSQLNWEHYIRKNSTSKNFVFGRLSVLATSGLIIATQSLSLALGILIFTQTPIEILLLICGILAMVGTLSLLVYYISDARKGFSSIEKKLESEGTQLVQPKDDAVIEE